MLVERRLDQSNSKQRRPPFRVEASQERILHDHVELVAFELVGVEQGDEDLVALRFE
jgi:hypothetical protein